jgi:hypothetical protein
MQSILVTGSDFDLLRTRAMVLNRAAPRIVCALPDQLDDLLQGLDFRQWCIPIVVLCHTLAPQHPELCRQIHAAAPDTRIIMLKESETPEHADDARCLLLPFHIKPELLLDSVQQVVNQQLS